MGYQLGVDLGTTFTAAAIHRDGRTQVIELGRRGASIPSVVLLREDQAVLTGDAANRRALTEPDRVAREFKRRLGDPTPVMVGGTPYSAEALMARLLTWVVDAVSERQGAEPESIVVSHPANWSEYKLDLFRQALRLADLEATLITEPEAAAIHYASQERMPPGEIVAVYDLGGGTFDAAVLRRTADGFELLGHPEGIERLGGIDFDAAVLSFVSEQLGGKLEELDPGDPGALAAVARLRADAVEAKETLSADVDVTIPVLLPNANTEVRLTRSEFEAMIRPTLSDTIGAMRRALSSAGVTADEVDRVLLVGGSSRIPLIGQLISAELGRPVAVDADPKHAIALGAALVAGGVRGASAPATAVAPQDPTPSDAPAAHESEGRRRAPLRAPAAAGGGAVAAEVADTPTAPEPQASPAVEPPAEPAPAAAPVDPAPTEPLPAAATAVTPATAAGSPASAPPPLPSSDDGGPSKTPLLIGAAVAAIVLIGGAVLAFGGNDGDDPVSAATSSTTEQSDADGDDTTTTTSTTTTTEPLPPGTRTVAIESFSDGVVGYTTNFSPDVASFHLHFFWDTYAPESVGTNAPAETRGNWTVWDVASDGSFTFDIANLEPNPGASMVCVVPATPTHGVDNPEIVDRLVSCIDIS